jgi:hypothetical protein
MCVQIGGRCVVCPLQWALPVWDSAGESGMGNFNENENKNEK